MHLRTIRLHPDDYPTATRFPFSIPVLQTTETVTLDGPVTFLVGENGCGKSTFIEALARRCGIHIWKQRGGARTQRNPFEKRLHRHMSVEWTNGPVPGSFFGSAAFTDFARILEEWAETDPGQLQYFGGRSLLTLSHGQSIMAYFRARYGIEGLYLMDEPETALSPKTQIELLGLLIEMGNAGHAQFVIATHSPLLLACPGATIYSFDHTPARRIAYEDTDHYRIYRDFLADPDRFLEAHGQAAATGTA